jgi:hypothetical protein
MGIRQLGQPSAVKGLGRSADTSTDMVGHARARHPGTFMRKIFRIVSVPWLRSHEEDSSDETKDEMSAHAPSAAAQAAAPQNQPGQRSERRRLEKRLKELGLHEIKDDGWGYRDQGGGGGPVGSPAKPGPIVTVEGTGGVPQRAPASS